ncbi:RIP metalloprotease RseP [Altererythrobacter sp.]|nr:RIP metalloprotease RseP [Altererythrobacter sp.]
MFESPPFWMYIFGFLLLLGPLVTLHELGHYLVGRWLGVKAEAFSVGFGKELIGRTDKHGTRWKLSALPLGGYVQFKGDMNPASVPDAEAVASATVDERDGSFHHASLGRRALIVAAGPFANILITLGIYAGFFYLLGTPVPVDAEQQLTISEFTEGSPAQEAGLRVGDRIVAVEGERMESFRDVQDSVMLFPGRTLDITYARGGSEATIPITTTSFEMEDGFGNKSKIGLIGVQAAEANYDFVPQGLLASMQMSVQHSVKLVDMMLTGIGQIFTGERSVKELGGPIKIAKYSGERLSMGPMSFVDFAALISLNLAFINLLPIPALDGGHLAFYAAEAVRRKPVGPRGMEMAYRTGIAIVLMLMIFVTFNDLASLSLFG